MSSFTKRTMIVRSLCIFVATASLIGCSSVGSGNEASLKEAAIQLALDSEQNEPSAPIVNGDQCATYGSTQMKPDPHIYSEISGAHVSAIGASTGGSGCVHISWDPSVRVRPVSTGFSLSTTENAPIGRFLVDKIGDDQQVNNGLVTVTATPFKAHFEASALGAALISRHIAEPALDITDGQAVLHKDADGKWIAQISSAK